MWSTIKHARVINIGDVLTIMRGEYCWHEFVMLALYRRSNLVFRLADQSSRPLDGILLRKLPAFRNSRNSATRAARLVPKGVCWTETRVRCEGGM